jgi:hypothetical protein
MVTEMIIGTLIKVHWDDLIEDYAMASLFAAFTVETLHDVLTWFLSATHEPPAS